MRPDTIPALAAVMLLFVGAPGLAQDTPPPAEPGREAQPGTRSNDPAEGESRPAEVTDAGLTPLAHVERRGNGPVEMILIPTLWCDWTVYEEFMTRNADRYTMYAVTFPGYSGSDPPPEPDDPKDFNSQPWRSNAARAIVKLIKDEQLDEPVLVGHFAAGQLAIRIALEHGALVGKAVSIDGPLALPQRGANGPATPRERQAIARRMATERVPQEFWATQVRNNAESLVANPGRAVLLGDMMASVPFPVAKRYWIETIAEDLTDRAAALRVPLLVVVPVPDRLEPAAAADLRDRWRAQFEHVETAELLFVEGARQFVMFDRPERLDEAIAEFVGAEPQDKADEADEGAAGTGGQ